MNTAASFVRGVHNTAALVMSHDWSKTALGPMDQWPNSVSAIVAMMLASPHAIVTLWGTEGIMIYNDAYAHIAGNRHPALLGQPVRDAWPEVSAFNDHVMKSCLAGATLSYRDQEMVLLRSGKPETVWLNLDYSPLFGDDNKPSGVIAFVAETTSAVMAKEQLKASEERLHFLDRLNGEISQLADADTILSTITRLLGQYMGVTSCAYADMDDDEDGFTIRGDWAAEGAVHIVGRYSLAAFGRLAVSELKSGRPLVINDNSTELEPHESATFQNIGIGATICMPLLKRGTLTALMAVHHQTSHVWTPDELTIVKEVTQRSWAYIERVAAFSAMQQSREEYRLALDAAELGVWKHDHSTNVVELDERAKAHYAVAANTVPIDTIVSRIHPSDRVRVVNAMQSALDPAIKGPVSIEYRIASDTGEVRWLSVYGRVYFERIGDDERPAHGIGTTEDITERKLAEEKVDYLAREVNHRSKNLLAVVQAIAKQTASGGDPRTFVARFGDRLAGLSASHDLLIQSNWTGVDLKELIRGQLAHFADLIGSRIIIRGIALQLTASAAQNIGLALHELSTNAAKYGSLSNKKGQLTISWNADLSDREGMFRLEWLESDGPPVSPPRTRGLGTQLITTLIERAFSGSTVLEYNPAGLTWALTAPVGNVLADI